MTTGTLPDEMRTIRSMAFEMERCATRARIVRDYATRAGIGGQGRMTPDVLAYRIAWDAPAAGDYPRPMLSDAVDCELIAPELAGRVWHHVAGATILGPLCCGTPASHRDALAAIAREIRAEVAAHGRDV